MKVQLPFNLNFNKLSLLCLMGALSCNATQGQRFRPVEQNLEPVVLDIIKEAKEHSELEQLAFELLDVVGPRLVGTPQMTKANEWALKTFERWGISAKNQQFGEWHGWERGISHIDMTYPRQKTLAGTQLAWSPTTNGKAIEAEVITLPEIKDSLSFRQWLPQVKGKYVLVSMYQPTGRPDSDWKEFATPASFEKMQRERDSLSLAWYKQIQATGLAANSIPSVLEDAGAVGILSSYWSKEFGSNKIFGARSHKAPSVDIALEDYGMLYRLAEKGYKPKIKVETS